MATAAARRIGILTGGGDCPGMNPVIKAVVTQGTAAGFAVVGIREGWRGLLSKDAANTAVLHPSDVRPLDQAGGTILGTSRTNPFSRPRGPETVMDNVKALKLEAIVAVGGDDTLGVARMLHEKFGLKAVGVPKTIDRDLSATSYTLGFESAVQVIMGAIDALRSTAESHSRVFVVETMGRNAGHLALKGGIAGGADIILIPEVPFDAGRVCQLLRERADKGLRHSIVVIAEGAKMKGFSELMLTPGVDEFGHRALGGIGYHLAREIEKCIKQETRYVVLSHLQRGGAPVAFDRRMGHYFGTAAVEAVQCGKFGCMLAVMEGRIKLVPLAWGVDRIKTVDVENEYDPGRYCAAVRILHCDGV